MTDRQQALASIVDATNAILGDEWVATLDARKREEASFHDADRDGRKDEGAHDANRRFYDAVPHLWNYREAWIAARGREGRTFLDYACGHGRMATLAAHAGSPLAVGIDISAVSVRNATERAKSEGLHDRCRFLQRDCEDTRLPSSAFGAALCSGMLHHLDLGRALPELHRIMTPGGRVLCIEAWNENPVARWYRQRTPQYRTAWETEHIIGMAALDQAWQVGFRVERMRFYGLSAVLAAASPNGLPGRATLIALGRALDRLLCRLPGLRRWSWIATFELVKH